MLASMSGKIKKNNMSSIFFKKAENKKVNSFFLREDVVVQVVCGSMLKSGGEVKVQRKLV